ncbi:hypothetical protein GF325_00125, partial [Candidatus Bathyarchaeota archaeon]|nr:hypothetical protein [Candidatus Bathyarchaeota archaeon]
MSVKIPEETQRKLASVLNHVEETSELIRCVVVTRSGIKVAPDMDADTYSASSAALIDLGERVVSSLNHGGLQELLINALGGYVILVAIGKEYMLLGATSAALKMGYYLPFMKKTAWTLEHIIYGDETTVIEELEKAHAEMEADTSPSQGEVQKQEITHDEIREADMAAMDDVLAAFDDFGINDDFTKGLGSDPVPSVGISNDEMVEISKKLQVEQEAVPDFSTTTPSPAKTLDVTTSSNQAEAGATIQD